MTDHMHEWEPLFDFHPDFLPENRADWAAAEWRCAYCGMMLGWEEVERRLNATERLSAEDARNIAVDKNKDNETEYYREGDALEAYAAALEGE